MNLNESSSAGYKGFMNKSQVKETSIDLTDCDKEKIHQISYVQSHGAFVAVSAQDMRIHNTSLNLGAFFGKAEAPDVFLNSRLNEVVSLDLFTVIKQKIKNEILKGQSKYSFEFKNNNEVIDVFIYSMGPNLIGIEFEKHPDSERFLSVSGQERLNDFILDMQKCSTMEELAKAACRAVRSLSGFDRVMTYRFFPPTMFGEVIGEDKVALM